MLKDNMTVEVLIDAPLLKGLVDPLVSVRGGFGEAGRDKLEALEGIDEGVRGELKGGGARCFFLFGL